MEISDVKNFPRPERRIFRANLRLYPSQVKFINENDLSVQMIFDKALAELGHVVPSQEEIEDTANMYGPRRTRGHGRGGKGDVWMQKYRRRHRR